MLLPSQRNQFLLQLPQCDVPDCNTKEIIFPKFKIPKKKETSYYCLLQETSPLENTNLVGFDALIDNSKYVHHILKIATTKIEARYLPRNEAFDCNTMANMAILGGIEEYPVTF
jgi:hypothetical protein